MLEKPFARIACVVLAGVMAVFIFVQAAPSPDPFIRIVPPWDKVVHFTYYGIMAGLLAHGAGRRWLWLPLILVPVIGAADELNQAGIPGRDSSVWDWVADLLGAIAAVAAYRYAVAMRRDREA